MFRSAIDTSVNTGKSLYNFTIGQVNKLAGTGFISMSIGVGISAVCCKQLCYNPEDIYPVLICQAAAQTAWNGVVLRPVLWVCNTVGSKIQQPSSKVGFIKTTATVLSIGMPFFASYMYGRDAVSTLVDLTGLSADRISIPAFLDPAYPALPSIATTTITTIVLSALRLF